MGDARRRPTDFLKISAGSAAVRSSVNLWPRRILTIATMTVLRKLSQQMSCYGNFCKKVKLQIFFAIEACCKIIIFATQAMLQFFWQQRPCFKKEIASDPTIERLSVTLLPLQHRSCCRKFLQHESCCRNFCKIFFWREVLLQFSFLWNRGLGSSFFCNWGLVAI